MEREDLVRQAWETLEPECVEQGFELVEVEFGRHGSTDVLRLFIDSEAGVTIDDCARVSRVISAVMDQGDFIEGSYMLEVSSPGIDRPLRKAKDFNRFSGERIKLVTTHPVGGRKRFSGVLSGVRDGMVSFEDDGTEYLIHVENVKKAKLDR